MREWGKPVFSADPALRRLAFSSPWGFFALGFGSGLFRAAPGTAGTVVAIPLAWGLLALPMLPALVVVASLMFAGIPLCRAAALVLGEEDPGAIVWDEIVGFCLAAVLVPAGLMWFAAAFFAFRFFDIVKPWPIRWLEKRLSGGVGVMADDIVAALYAVILLRALEWAAR